MTTTAKIGIFLVIILVILMIIWTWVQRSSQKTVLETNTNTVEMTPLPTPSPKLPNTAGTGMSSDADSSLEAIETDLNAVGKQLTELNGDTMGIDYGINVVNK